MVNRESRIRLDAVLLIILVLFFALVAGWKALKLDGSLDERQRSNLKNELFRTYWLDLSNDNFHAISRRSEEFGIAIALNEIDGKRVPFYVQIWTNYPAHKSYVIGKYDTQQDINFLSQSRRSEYDPEKGIYNPLPPLPEREILDLYGTDVIFQDSKGQLVKKVKVGKGRIDAPPDTVANLSILFDRQGEQNQDSYDDVLMFLANSTDSKIDIKIKDSAGVIHTHKVPTVGIKDWIFSLREKAVYMGF